MCYGGLVSYGSYRIRGFCTSTLTLGVPRGLEMSPEELAKTLGASDPEHEYFVRDGEVYYRSNARKVTLRK